MIRLSSFARTSLLAASFGALLFGQTERRRSRMDGAVHRGESSTDWRATLSAERIRAMAQPRRKFALRPLSAAESRPVARKPGLTPVGVSRTLPDDVLAQGEWSITSEGKRVWRLSLQSTGAAAVRIRFTDFHIGDGNAWLLGAGTDGNAVTVGPYTGDGPFGDGVFWSDIVMGDSVIVAYEPGPSAATTDAVPFRPAEISHRLPKARAARAEATSTPLAGAASCALDVSCYPQYAEPASAVALMIFESDGGTYECTGSLISSQSQPPVPFFMTANHCISTAEEARSLISLFNYQTPVCGGTPPTLGSLPRVNGATLIAGQPMALGDFTLLQLNAFPNVDVKVLGWYSDPIGAAEQVTGISHPVGDYKRISFGQRTRDVTIRFSDGERMPASVGYQVDWLQGVTQGGSSGSPMLANINGKQYLVGTLTAGPDVDENNDLQVCRVSNLVASYGRFSAAFPYLSGILTSSTSNSGTAQGTITANPNPITLAAGKTLGKTTLTWQTTGATQVQIRVGSATGTPLTGFAPATGSAETGDWVSDGMIFYLQNASDGASSGSAKTIATVRVTVSAPGGTKNGAITATPSPIVVAAGQTVGATRLNWQTTGVTQTQVRVGSPSGPPLNGFDAVNGSAVTGPWVTDGMIFYLQDASSGDSSGVGKTLASVQVRLQSR